MGVCRGDGGGVVMVVAWPWVSGLRFLGLLWGGGMAMGFGLGMFFVVVVIASRGDLGFGIYYFIM